jgi:hypothetical protein
MDKASSELLDHEPLWRYVDLATLIWTLSERKLFFRDPATSDDPFEGQLCKSDVENIRAWQGQHADHNRKFFGRLSDFPIFISCWHNHQTESAVMWRAYGSSVSVCLRTCVGRLRGALPKAGKISRVKYIDYDLESFEINNIFNHYSHKRLPFAGEQEVRAILMPPSVEIEDVETFDCGASGIAIGIDPGNLFEEIVLGPDLCPWFESSLVTLLVSLGFDIPVRQTQMSADPYRVFKHVPTTVQVPWELEAKVHVPRFVFGQVEQEPSHDVPRPVNHNESKPESP